MNATVRHLVGVWNPSYSRTAMDEHLEVLLDFADGFRTEGYPIEEVYVWWGKVKSPNRQKPQEHASEIIAAAQNGEHSEVHLYLTDYRSLYVGRVLGVAVGDLHEDEAEHAPDYYARSEYKCDFWFKLGDIRRLVVDDTPLVVEELRKLSNCHYNGRPVSLYGGMVDLPLVVTRADPVSYFDDRELTDGRLWAEVDAEAGAGAGAMERELRDNRFGPQLWTALDPATRTFIATGERIFREHRNDAAFDLSNVLVQFTKALEAQSSAVLRAVLPKVPLKHRILNVRGESVDLLERPPRGLADIARAIDDDESRYKLIDNLLENGRWFTGSLPSVMRELSDDRNAAAHGEPVDPAVVTNWRNRMIGVGSVGEFVELARTRLKR